MQYDLICINCIRIGKFWQGIVGQQILGLIQNVYEIPLKFSLVPNHVSWTKNAQDMLDRTKCPARELVHSSMLTEIFNSHDKVVFYKQKF